MQSALCLDYLGCNGRVARPAPIDLSATSCVPWTLPTIVHHSHSERTIESNEPRRRTTSAAVRSRFKPFL